MANLAIWNSLLQQPKSVGDYDREADAGDLRQLQILQGKQTLDKTTRANRRADQLMQLSQGLPAGTDDTGRMNALRGGGFYDEADNLDKNIQERRKIGAAAGKDEASTAESKFKLEKDKRTFVVQGLQQFRQPEDARQWLADSVVAGRIPMTEATQMIGKVPTGDPAAFEQWRDGMLTSLLDADKAAPYIKPTAAAKLAADTSVTNNTATNTRTAADNAAARAVTMRGQDIGKQKTDAVIAAGKDKLTNKNMSATLQKELIEQDDSVNAGSKTLDILKAALGHNDKAYSGYGALERATARSQLPGNKDSADATVQYDNLIKQQALGNLKAMFGGNPTEGERAVALVTSASVDKTPKQRAAIIAEVKGMVEKQIANAKSRAASIRSGKFLTEGTDTGDELLRAMAAHGGE